MSRPGGRPPGLRPAWGTSTQTRGAVLAMGGFALAMSWLSISSLRADLAHARSGSPPAAQMQHVEGRVTRWRDCTSGGRGRGRVENVTLQDDHGATAVEIPCVLPAGSLSDGRPHRMAVVRRQRDEGVPLVYEVTLDGATLLAYDTVAQREASEQRVIDRALPFLLAQAALLVMTLYSATQVRWRRARSPP